MKKAEDLLIYDIIRLKSSNDYKKIEKIIKNKVILIPLIYIVGTISLIFRNQFLKLPFNYISIVQLAVILAYLVVYIGCYMIIELALIKLFEKDHKIKKIGILLLLEFCSWYMIYWFVQDFKISIILFIFFYIILPSLSIFLEKFKHYINLLTITSFLIIILYIPIQYGGFKGQLVVYHNYETKEEIECTYYGNYDGLYQFAKDDIITLMPIDSGYIEYKK